MSILDLFRRKRKTTEDRVATPPPQASDPVPQPATKAREDPRHRTNRGAFGRSDGCKRWAKARG